MRQIGNSINEYVVFGQLVAADGSFIGGELQINMYTDGAQRGHSVYSNSLDYLITWNSEGQDGDDYGVYGRFLDFEGNFLTDEFLINTYTIGAQNAAIGTDYLVT